MLKISIANYFNAVPIHVHGLFIKATNSAEKITHLIFDMQNYYRCAKLSVYIIIISLNSSTPSKLNKPKIN